MEPSGEAYTWLWDRCGWSGAQNWVCVRALLAFQPAHDWPSKVWFWEASVGSIGYMRGWVRGGESRAQGTVGATSVVMLSHQVLYWSRASRKRKMGLVWDFKARKVRTWWLKIWKPKEINVTKKVFSLGAEVFPPHSSFLLLCFLNSYSPDLSGECPLSFKTPFKCLLSAKPFLPRLTPPSG